MRISLVTVSYFSAREIGRLIFSFKRELEREGLQGEIIVVDNSGNDRSLDSVDADIILHSKNVGYARGINLGVKEATGDLLFLANPDLCFMPSSLSNIRSYINSRAIFGPQFSLGKWFFSPQRSFDLIETLYLYIVSRNFTLWKRAFYKQIYNTLKICVSKDPVKVKNISGALMVIGRDSYEPLPENYFLFFEETEWLFMMRKKGVKVFIDPNLVVEHNWGHSLDRLNFNYFDKSLNIYLNRRYNRLVAFFMLKLLDKIWKTDLDDKLRSLPTEVDLIVYSPLKVGFPCAVWVGDNMIDKALGVLERAGKTKGTLFIVSGTNLWCGDIDETKKYIYLRE